MTSQHRMSLTEWGLLTLLSLLWGGSFFFAKIAVDALPPLTVAPVWAAVPPVAYPATKRSSQWIV